MATLSRKSWLSHLARGAALLIAVINVGCFSPEANEHGAVDSLQASLHGPNGITLNGITLNGITLNGITLNGLGLEAQNMNDVELNGASLTSEQSAEYAEFYRYLAECALRDDQSAKIYNFDGTASTVQGLFGLAPEWRTSPLSLEGQRKVSACLAARSNHAGQHVLVSLRGAGMDTTPVERGTYLRHEGAFWGNLFGANPGLKACSVSGVNPLGRVCASPDSPCHFTYVGECASVCTSQDPIDGAYSECAGESAVINTFLDLGAPLVFGYDNACTIDAAGGLWCWGVNGSGQLGLGNTQSYVSQQTHVSTLGNTSAEITTGGNHTCARHGDGNVSCWGRNNAGQLGNGTLNMTSYPVEASITGVVDMAAGNAHTCSVSTAGAVSCWGKNDRGQLGIGSTSLKTQPVTLASLQGDVIQLASYPTAEHTCALKQTGEVWCWGANDAGQLGDGTKATRTAPVPVTLTATNGSFGNVTDVCTMSTRSCARKADGTLWCWGNHDVRPVQVASDAERGSLSCGYAHACFLKPDDSVWCFGDNSRGQLSSYGTSSSTPVRVNGIGSARRVYAGAQHTCAQETSGRMMCWGTNSGLFSTTLSATPREVTIGSRFPL